MNKNRKRTFDDAFENENQEDYVYGIISTGVDWIYLKISSNFISITPIADAQHITLSESAIGDIKLENNINEVLGTIVWLLEDRKKLIQRPKKQRTV